MFTWKEARPEDFGIPAEAVGQLEGQLKEMRLRIHGFMLIKGENILAERYYEPFGRDKLHRMYSITKSFTALAVGLLVKNGLVKPEDRICDYFPEKLPEGGAHPWCREMTIRDMLTMRTCHSSTTYKRHGGKDWTESFFHVAPDHVPGTVFSYDTSSSQVLAALVEKLTGKKMLDYMRSQILDQLGFSKEAYILPDPVGVSQGGSGLVCTLRDVAAVAHLCCRMGSIQGREYLPADYMQEATGGQVPTDLQPVLDEQCGYGYFIWKPREEGFTFFGMGGQLAVCFPQYDFCYITMADTIGNPAGVQALHDCFYRTVFPCLKASSPSGTHGAKAYGSTCEGICEEKREQGFLSMEKGLRESTQAVPYAFYPNALEWEEVCFDWEQKEMSLALSGNRYTIAFGTEEWVRQPLLDTEYFCECRGQWKMGHFILECYVLYEDMGNIRMDFAWKDHRMSVRSVCAGEVFPPEMKSHYQGFASAERNGGQSVNQAG